MWFLSEKSNMCPLCNMASLKISQEVRHQQHLTFSEFGDTKGKKVRYSKLKVWHLHKCENCAFKNLSFLVNSQGLARASFINWNLWFWTQSLLVSCGMMLKVYISLVLNYWSRLLDGVSIKTCLIAQILILNLCSKFNFEFDKRYSKLD